MKEQELAMSRKIKIRAFKYNPLSKISKPHFAEYELEETDGMTLLSRLIKLEKNLIRGLVLILCAVLGFAGVAVW